MSDRIIVYTDGGSRGNPGPSAWGYYIQRLGEMPVVEYGFMGTATNSEAEYAGLIAALRHLVETGCREEVDFRLDSALVVGQVSKGWAVNAKHLVPLRDEARMLLGKLPKWSMMHIPRAQNSVADAAVNRALDERRA